MAIVYLGTRPADLINRILMVGLVGTFFAILFYTAPYITLESFSAPNQHFSLSPLPVLMTTLGFQMVIPTVRAYMAGTGEELSKVIWIGSLIPLVVYSLWELWIFGIFSAGNLHMIGASKEPAAAIIQGLASVAHFPEMVQIAAYFTIFLIVTSLIGVSLSLFDFIADGLKMSKVGFKRVALMALTFLPPAFILYLFPESFVQAFRFAGIMVAGIFGVFPALMVIKMRNGRFKQTYRTPGGGFMLYATLFFFSGIIVSEVVRLCA